MIDRCLSCRIGAVLVYNELTEDIVINSFQSQLSSVHREYGIAGVKKRRWDVGCAQNKKLKIAQRLGSYCSEEAAFADRHIRKSALSGPWWTSSLIHKISIPLLVAKSVKAREQRDS